MLKDGKTVYSNAYNFKISAALKSDINV